MREPYYSKIIKSKKISGKAGEEVEPQEVFLDNLAKKREEEFGITEKKFEIPISKRASQGIFLVFLFLFFIFFAKSFYLQILKNGELSLLAQNNKARVSLIRPERGVIYDSSLRQLVVNLPSFDLICDQRNFPYNNDQKLAILGELSVILNKDFNELRKQVEKSQIPEILVSENLNQEALIKLETNPLLAKKKGEPPLCKVEMNTVRNYISDFNSSHLIGYMGKINLEELETAENYSFSDYIGKSGIEKSYEKILRGEVGKWKIEKNAVGQTKSESLSSEPKAGNSVVLWLDSDLQKKSEQALGEILAQTGSKAGAIVALNPKTGGVLTMVSLPEFDNNLFSKGIDTESFQNNLNDPGKPLFNRVIAGEYPTGSTIKPLIASAALQEKIISPEKRINDPGYIQIPHEYDPEIVYTFNDWMAHGWADMRKAIAVSCNVYFYTIGGGYQDQEGLGADRIKKYLELFGWGEKTGIDLAGETKGLIPSPQWMKEVKGEIWYTGNTYNFSIGQGDLRVTPLQVVNAFAAIANGGTLYQPHMVQRIIDENKNTIEEIKPVVIRQNFIDAENLKIVREGMRDAVTYGSSVTLNDLPVEAAAKTGTAETSKDKVYHNWVTVFAPYDDPQIVITIVVENVPEGMVVALPVAKEILNYYFSR